MTNYVLDLHTCDFDNKAVGGYMLETILLALLVAKIKGYNIKPLFKSWAIYPIIIMELITIFVQVMIFSGNYDAVSYLAMSKSFYLVVYLFLVYKYELYGSALIGSVSMIGGGMLNDIAIKANNGFMPVYPTLSYLTGYTKPEMFSIVQDIHILGGVDTNLKILTDFIDVGYSVFSIGDVFIRVFVFLIIYNSIKKINKMAIEEDVIC